MSSRKSLDVDASANAAAAAIVGGARRAHRCSREFVDVLVIERD
jgi:hypothetical protein